MYYNFLAFSNKINPVVDYQGNFSIFFDFSIFYISDISSIRRLETKLRNRD